MTRLTTITRLKIGKKFVAVAASRSGASCTLICACCHKIETEDKFFAVLDAAPWTYVCADCKDTLATSVEEVAHDPVG